MGYVIIPLLRIFSWTLYFIPGRVRLALGDGIGLILSALGFRRAVIAQNVRYAFPSDPGKQRWLVREAYRHLGRLGLEILFLFGPMPRFARRNIRMIGTEHILEALRAGHGAIFLSSHVGNWEIMAAGGGMNVPGLKTLLVTKHLKPEWLHQAVEQGRSLSEVSGTYEPKTLKDVLRHLKSGQIVGFVLDQYAGAPVGMRVPVFGIPVGTTTAVAMLAKRTGAPVLPVVNYRLPNGNYVVDVRPAIAWETSCNPDGTPAATEELGLNTARYAALLEKDIYAHPEQWLWSHRRFKGDLSPLRPQEWSEGRSRR